MAAGDTWDESNPTNNTLANEIDDNMRDMKSGVRGRMAHEHSWPSSQTGTVEAGFHTFVTFTPQTGAPSLVYSTNTQGGALYINTDFNLVFENSAGSSIVVAYSAGGVKFFGGTGTLGAIPYVTSGGGFSTLATPAATNSLLVAQGTTAPPGYVVPKNVFVVTSGQANHAATVALPSGVNSDEVQGIMVSIGNDGSAQGTSNPDGFSTTCSIDANRVVTAVWDGLGAGGSGTCVANYLLVALVTH